VHYKYEIRDINAGIPGGYVRVTAYYLHVLAALEPAAYLRTLFKRNCVCLLLTEIDSITEH